MSFPTTLAPVTSFGTDSALEVPQYRQCHYPMNCVSCSIGSTSCFIDPNSCFIDPISCFIDPNSSCVNPNSSCVHPDLSLIDQDCFQSDPTNEDFFQNNASTTSARLIDLGGPGSGIFEPASNPLSTLSSESVPLTTSTCDSVILQVDRKYNVATQCNKSGDGLLPSASENLVTMRPRGRPRKDLSTKQTTPPPSDSLTKYRAKNRRASARCREKERAQAAALEKICQEQLERNATLKQKEVDLREELFGLQMQALHHGNCECGDVQSYNGRRAQDVAKAWNLDCRQPTPPRVREQSVPYFQPRSGYLDTL